VTAQRPDGPPDRTPPALTTTASPFARLALAHAVSVMGDAFLTVALAGSLFFTVSPGEARPKVLLYLVLTMVPFVLLAPVLGPAMDRTRGGKRLLIVLSALARGVLALLMASHLDSLLLYPEAFGALMLSKGYSVAKSALVPSLVGDEAELVRANSRLALISGIAAAVGGLPAAGILTLLDASWVLRFGTLVYVAAALLGTAIPKASRVGPDETAEQRAELHAGSILVAGTAMGLLRAVVGFVTFFLAFVLKEDGAPAWFYGAVFVASGAGNFTGILLAPLLRRKLREEWILVGSLVVPAALTLFAARAASRPAYMLTGYAVATGAAAGRVAFDSLLQRDAPEAARGRAFARFETRFQLVWVIGGVVAVALVGVSDRTGLFLASLVLGFGGLSYLGAIRAPQAAPVHPPAHGGPHRLLRRPPRQQAPPADDGDAFPAGG
jgi:hypothetical protein